MSAPAPSGLCPSCNRYIGPAGCCPYCTATATASPMLKAIRVTAVLLATAGLLLLYVASRHSDPPLVGISEITPVMNFAHVRVSGTVTKRAYVSKDRGYVGFTIDDGSGRLRVVAYRNVAKTLFADKTLPAGGDEVDVRGSLSVSANSEPKLYLKSTDHLTTKSKRSRPTS
jgi:hypothetical protein